MYPEPLFQFFDRAEVSSVEELREVIDDLSEEEDRERIREFIQRIAFLEGIGINLRLREIVTFQSPAGRDIESGDVVPIIPNTEDEDERYNIRLAAQLEGIIEEHGEVTVRFFIDDEEVGSDRLFDPEEATVVAEDMDFQLPVDGPEAEGRTYTNYRMILDVEAPLRKEEEEEDRLPYIMKDVEVRAELPNGGMSRQIVEDVIFGNNFFVVEGEVEAVEAGPASYYDSLIHGWLSLQGDDFYLGFRPHAEGDTTHHYEEGLYKVIAPTAAVDELGAQLCCHADDQAFDTTAEHGGMLEVTAHSEEGIQGVFAFDAVDDASSLSPDIVNIWGAFLVGDPWSSQ